MKNPHSASLSQKAADGLVLHRLIHLDFESNRYRPSRRHDDHDHEGYAQRLQEFFLHQLEKGRLSYIAVIPAADGPKGLSEVFALSNSIDRPWTENEGVQVHPWLAGQRSTSVGDLVVVHDQVLMVDSFGFVNLSRLFEALQGKLIAPVDSRLQSAPSREREFDFIGPLGFPMRAILTLKGEPFLHSSRAPHDSEDPIIRLMDMRSWPEKGGQMMSSYYLSTFLAADANGTGITLDGGVKGWFIEARQVQLVSAWAREVLSITADREMACKAAMSQLREALGGELFNQACAGEWVTSTRDQLTCGFQYRAVDKESPYPVRATATFSPETSVLLSLELAEKDSNEVLARYESDDQAGVALHSERPDFSM